jgi:hypothetical protein
MATLTTRGKKNGSAVHRAGAQLIRQSDLNPHVIRRRAYEIYLGRKGGPGDHLSDWIQAERELERVTGHPPNGHTPRGRGRALLPAEARLTSIGAGIMDSFD